MPINALAALMLRKSACGIMTPHKERPEACPKKQVLAMKRGKAAVNRAPRFEVANLKLAAAV
jgi:hypothetical protein